MLSSEPLHTLQGNEDEVYAVSIGYNDTLIAVGAQDGLIRVYDSSSGEQTRLRTAHKHNPVYGLEFFADSPLLVSAGGDGVRMGYVIGESPVPSIPNKHTRGVLCTAARTGVRHFASGAFDGKIIIWDILSGTDIHHLDAHNKAASRLAFNRDGSTLLSCGYDKRICGWDPFSGKQFFELQAHQGECCSVEFTPDETGFISTGEDKIVKLWNASTREPTEVGKTEAGPSRARIHPDGDQIGVPASDGTVTTFRLKNPGKALQVQKAHDGVAYDLAYSRNGLFAVTGGADKLAKIWQVV
jgi:WD40 repeat protein